jgi:hypothetical protein
MENPSFVCFGLYGRPSRNTSSSKSECNSLKDRLHALAFGPGRLAALGRDSGMSIVAGMHGRWSRNLVSVIGSFCSNTG